VIAAGREKFASAEEAKKEEKVEEKEESDDVSVFHLDNCSLFIHPMLLFYQDYLSNQL
jgi:hypothetical protein